jgi:coproporphyrinogen III oxidase-like Fe-S oxidoreductase
VDLSILSPRSTYELNPEDDVDGLLEILQAIAIPRISIGVQSFDDRILHSIGRRYCQGDISRIIERVAKRGFPSINLDLINGFPPHQEFENWKRELARLGTLFESGAIQSATLYMLHPFPQTSLPGHPADSYWQTRNLCFAREYLCDRLQLQERPIYWFQKERAETEEAFAPSFSIFGYGNSSYSSLGRWLLQNEPSLKAYMAHKREDESNASLPIQYVFRLTPKQMQIRALLFAIRSGSFKLGQKELDRMSPLFKKLFQKFEQGDLLERKKDLYGLTEAGKIFAHQMPIFFFDPEVKKNFYDYLESRFAPATERSDRF